MMFNKGKVKINIFLLPQDPDLYLTDLLLFQQKAKAFFFFKLYLFLRTWIFCLFLLKFCVCFSLTFMNSGWQFVSFMQYYSLD